MAYQDIGTGGSGHGAGLLGNLLKTLQFFTEAASRQRPSTGAERAQGQLRWKIGLGLAPSDFKGDQVG